MDPNAALAKAVESLANYRLADVQNARGKLSDTECSARMADAADELADAFKALHGWMINGGFLERIPKSNPATAEKREVRNRIAQLERELGTQTNAA